MAFIINTLSFFAAVALDENYSDAWLWKGYCENELN